MVVMLRIDIDEAKSLLIYLSELYYKRLLITPVGVCRACTRGAQFKLRAFFLDTIGAPAGWVGRAPLWPIYG